MTAVDVIIPAFNAEKFIGDALSSVRAQTCPLNRIIVVDDGSTDRTVERVAAFSRQTTPGMIVLVSQANAGPSAARNTGVRKSEAPYIAFLDADDTWAPDKIELQMRLFAAGDFALGVVYCDAAGMTEDGTVIASRSRKTMYRGNIARALLKGNVVRGSASAVVIRRAALDLAGPFDEVLRSGEDWDMWLRLSRHCRFDFVDRKLVYLRRSSGDGQALRRRRLDQELAFLDKRTREGDLAPSAVRSFRRRMAELGLRGSDLERWSAISPELRRALASASGKVGHLLGVTNRQIRLLK